MSVQQQQEQEEEQEEFVSFEIIEKLQDNGINAADIKKLKDHGCCTIGSVLNCTTKELTSIKGFSDAKVEKIKEVCKKLIPRGFRTANVALQLRGHIYKMTTGSRELDKLLQGGIESKSITEIFGEFRSGKTQMCLTLCVTCQLPRSQGGGDGKVIYIDTEGTFRPERVTQIANRFNMEPTEVLENILWARAFTHEEQMQLVNHAAMQIVDDTSSYRLLIIDSVTALFRNEFSGRGELSERQQKLCKHLSALMKLAEEFNIAVLLVNQVTADPSGGMSAFVGEVRKPIGGHIMAHASTTRLYLKKAKGNTRVCSVYDSPMLPPNDATFAIGEGGLEDE